MRYQTIKTKLQKLYQNQENNRSVFEAKENIPLQPLGHTQTFDKLITLDTEEQNYLFSSVYPVWYSSEPGVMLPLATQIAYLYEGELFDKDIPFLNLNIQPINVSDYEFHSLVSGEYTSREWLYNRAIFDGNGLIFKGTPPSTSSPLLYYTETQLLNGQFEEDHTKKVYKLEAQYTENLKETYILAVVQRLDIKSNWLVGRTRVDNTKDYNYDLFTTYSLPDNPDILYFTNYAEWNNLRTITKILDYTRSGSNYTNPLGSLSLKGIQWKYRWTPIPGTRWTYTGPLSIYNFDPNPPAWGEWSTAPYESGYVHTYIGNLGYTSDPDNIPTRWAFVADTFSDPNTYYPGPDCPSSYPEQYTRNTVNWEIKKDQSSGNVSKSFDLSNLSSYQFYFGMYGVKRQKNLGGSWVTIVNNNAFDLYFGAEMGFTPASYLATSWVLFDLFHDGYWVYYEEDTVKRIRINASTGELDNIDSTIWPEFGDTSTLKLKTNPEEGVGLRVKKPSEYYTPYEYNITKDTNYQANRNKYRYWIYWYIYLYAPATIEVKSNYTENTKTYTKVTYGSPVQTYFTKTSETNTAKSFSNWEPGNLTIPCRFNLTLKPSLYFNELRYYKK